VDDITITAKVVLGVASIAGPLLLAAFGLWSRMSRWQATTAASIASLQIDLARVELERKQREAEARAHADEAHRRMGQIQVEISKVRESLGFLRGQLGVMGANGE
jgi:hypothetical protein